VAAIRNAALDGRALEAAAKELGVEAIAIDAVAEVETKGAAFEDEGRPTILFERHVFSRLTRHRFRSHAPRHLRTPARADTAARAAMYGRLERAFKLAPYGGAEVGVLGPLPDHGREPQAGRLRHPCKASWRRWRGPRRALKAFVAFVGASQGAWCRP
jgi:hypothetical protein